MCNLLVQGGHHASGLESKWRSPLHFQNCIYNIYVSLLEINVLKLLISLVRTKPKCFGNPHSFQYTF